jgi:hypothetical protein
MIDIIMEYRSCIRKCHILCRWRVHCSQHVGHHTVVYNIKLSVIAIGFDSDDKSKRNLFCATRQQHLGDRCLHVDSIYSDVRLA